MHPFFFFRPLVSAPALICMSRGPGGPFKYDRPFDLSQYGAVRILRPKDLEPRMQSLGRVTHGAGTGPIRQWREPRTSIPQSRRRTIGSRFEHPRVHPRALLAHGEPGRQNCLRFSNGAMLGVAQGHGKPSRRFCAAIPTCRGMSFGNAHRGWGSRTRPRETKQRNSIGDGRRMRISSCCNSAVSIQHG